MDNERRFDLILTIVNRGFSDQVMEAAKAAGAHGGTVFHARGTGIHEAEKFLAYPYNRKKKLL